jgi:hypothetical protein
MNNYIIEIGISFERDDMQSSLWSLFYNINANRLTVEMEGKPAGLESDQRKIVDRTQAILQAGFSAEWLLSKEGFFMKLIIPAESKDMTLLTPISPFKLKRDLEGKHESIDLGFYIGCCIALSENFLVSDLKTSKY